MTRPRISMGFRGFFFVFYRLVPFLVLAFGGAGATPVDCAGDKLDLLVLGDSQSGADWSTSYFGDFLQRCLAANPRLRFAVYGRGGTSPSDWISRSSLDRVSTVYRDHDHPKFNLGGTDAPVCRKRLPALIGIHHPTRVVLQFGDNLITQSEGEIKAEFRKAISIVKGAGIQPGQCFVVTPTFEMSVKSHRNVRAKSLESSQRVTEAVREAIGSDCALVDGMELMRESPYFQASLLKREGVPGTTGCFGAAENDNIHVCGGAARDYAERVCARLGGEL